MTCTRLFISVVFWIDRRSGKGSVKGSASERNAKLSAGAEKTLPASGISSANSGKRPSGWRRSVSAFASNGNVWRPKRLSW